MVTVWRERYEADIFFRTTVNIVALLAALVLVCVGLFWFVLHFTDDAVVHAIVENIHAIVTGSGTPEPLSSSIRSIQTVSILSVFFGLVAVAILFGLLFARFMLWPTRNSLHYQKIFISNVAHELRTPLSTIKTTTEVALLDDSLPIAMRGTLEEIVHELDRISEIINNLLSLNSLTRPERMQLRAVALGPLVDTVVGRHLALAQERKVEIRVHKDTHDLVWGNATGLEQIFTNLIKNAISYTQKNTGGIVVVALEPDYRGSVIFSVTDNGIGISQTDLGHIFEPFYRADTSRMRDIRKSGSGLGLAIVNEIVRAHHGKIHIQSTRNKGTIVSVSLPVGVNAGAEPPRESRDKSEMSIDFSSGSTHVTMTK